MPNSTDSPLRGIALKLISTISFSLMAACAKAASSEVSGSIMVLVRAAVMLAVVTPLVAYRKVPFFGKHHVLIHLRCSLGALALHLYFYAISQAPLGSVVVLGNSAPLFVPILAIFFLGERPKLETIPILLAGFGGVILVLNPSFETFDSGRLAASSVGVIVAITIVCLKKLAGKEDPLTVVFCFSLWTFVTALLRPETWEGSLHDIGTVWHYLLLAGLFAVSGQFFLTSSLSFAPAVVIVLINHLSVALSFIFGLVFWDEVPEVAGLAGAGLIVGSSILTALWARRLVGSSSSAPKSAET
ncbi:MAG: DMT family transporter [Planctomycetota bacterium]